jgi:DNA-binding transcriptional LysR family regulator
MWLAVELREIRAFIVLADELHFARTAERLQLTPSRVSQIIRELERKLGVQLVRRTSCCSWGGW